MSIPETEMASQWTDKSAIMRDLSFAQGRWVPGSIDTAITSGTPPAHNLNEETEEEYYKRWAGDGDFSACPDFSLISKMLEMVQDDVPDTKDIQTGPVEIRKLDPVAKVFVPKLKQVKQIKPKTEKTDKKKKPLPERNVAIASIIANSLKLSQDVKEAPIKLSRPEDFIKTSSLAPNIEELHALRKRNDSVHKVNSWLQSQDMNCMFKKKSSESPKSPSPGQSDASARSLRNPGQQYVPSSWAGEYYKKCIERTHIRDMVQENVWARAEKIMQEIDIRKAEKQKKQEEEDAALAAAMAEAEQEAPPSEAKNDDDTDEHDEPVADSQGLASVLLPKHRHLLTGDCVVCKVLSKKPSENLFETKEVENDKPEFQDAIDETDKNHDEDYFCLVRSSLVENLADKEAAENKLEESDSTENTEILDVSTSES
ncbi:uncharacterized protein isoform X2 [Choristoneura fumiferana]